MIRVSGSLIKTRLKDADGYKFSVSPKYRYFNDLESAIRYANNIYYITGVMLGVIDVTRKNPLTKKKKIINIIESGVLNVYNRA